MRKHMLKPLIWCVMLVGALCMPTPTEALDSTKSSFANTEVTSRYITVALGTIIEWPQNGTLPPDAGEKWLECNGQPIPRDSDLFKQRGMEVTPNLYENGGYFLRASATSRNKFEDTTRSHNHKQPEHTHAWTGRLVDPSTSAQLVDKKVTGWADGQLYGDWTMSTTSGHPMSGEIVKDVASLPVWFEWDGVRPSGWTGSVIKQETLNQRMFLQDTAHWRATASPNDPYTPKGSEVTSQVTNGVSVGNVNDGTVVGTVWESGGDQTHYTAMKGDSRTSTVSAQKDTETAPVHYTTRYFIKIND